MNPNEENLRDLLSKNNWKLPTDDPIKMLDLFKAASSVLVKDRDLNRPDDSPYGMPSKNSTQ